jgi:Cu/Ag efflux protein CusF
MKLTSNLHQTLLATCCTLALGLGTIHAGEATKARSEHGTIKSVDAKTHRLVITTGKGNSEYRFHWNDQTKFTSGHNAATASDLKEGRLVELTYVPGGDAPTLQRVRLAAKAPKHPTAHQPSPHRAS